VVDASVGPYRILAKLGAGGMGDVYLAEDTRLHRRVALKSLSEALLKGPGARETLLREARSAATLNHPNIAAIYDVVETGDTTHIVMEYVEGESLSHRLERGRLPPDEVAAVALQLCDAMAAAHAAGVVHRDLKPGNVSLTHDGKLKVLDFGLATRSGADAEPVAATDTTPSRGEAILGTPAYMAPEQLRRDPADARTDIYSAGVMLYELATGRRPFQGQGVVDLGVAILTQPTPFAADAEPTVPPALSAIIRRAMARSPADRFQSALAMREALGRLPVAVSESPTVSAAFPWDRTTRRTLGLASRPRWILALLALAVAIGGALAFLRLVEPRAPAAGRAAAERPAVAVLPLANLGGTPEHDYIGVGFADALATNLANLPSLSVVSRSATQEYQGTPPDTRRLARELGLSYVVSGSVQQAERRLRVSVQLMRPDATVAWTHEYEGRLDDLFRLQRQAAEGLAAAIAPAEPGGPAGWSGPATRDLEAFADYARGRALLERLEVAGNVAKAVEAFERAIGRDPGFALAHAGLGEAFWARYQETQDASFTVKARDAAVEALRLDPERAATRYTLAVIYSGTGRPEQALEQLERVLSLQPGDDDASRLMGNVLAERGRWEEAEGALRRAIERRPGYWRNHASLGHLYYRTGRQPQAIAAFRRVTELQPDNSRGFQMLGTAYQAAGQEEQALASYQQALKLAPDAKAYSNVGNIRFGQGRFEDAARAWEEAARLEPRDPLKQRNLADAYARLGRRDGASRAYDRAVALSREKLAVNPHDAASLSMLAVCEAKLGRRGDARRHAAAALALAPDDADTLYESALVHVLAGELQPALSALERALERGYSRSLARRDEDLAPLRRLDGFRTLVDER